MKEGTIANVAVLQSPWPPPVSVEILSTDLGSTRVRLIATTKGSLVATVEHACGEVRSREFGPLQVQGVARILLILTWAADRMELEVNGVELGEAAISATALRLNNQVATPLPGLVLPDLEMFAGCSNDERLFVATLADIDRKVLAGGWYNLIRASGLLRQLLCDENPLLHVVNRAHHVAIRFETVDFRTPPPGSPDVHWQALDPRMFPGAQTVVCNLGQFLAAPCLRWQGHEATVKDLIRTCANAKGGVHLGSARTENEQAVIDWDKACVILGEQPSLRVIAGICRVALSGCREVVDAIGRQIAQP